MLSVSLRRLVALFWNYVAPNSFVRPSSPSPERCRSLVRPVGRLAHNWWAYGCALHFIAGTRAQGRANRLTRTPFGLREFHSLARNPRTSCGSVRAGPHGSVESNLHLCASTRALARSNSVALVACTLMCPSGAAVPSRTGFGLRAAQSTLRVLAVPRTA